jgi:hypothetical protein
VKLIKLDRRYALSHRWKYAIQFSRHFNHGKIEKAQYATAFTKLYGEDMKINPDWHVGECKPMYLHNDHWHNDFNRMRIYFNNEADLTAVMLMIDHGHN